MAVPPVHCFFKQPSPEKNGSPEKANHHKAPGESTELTLFPSQYVKVMPFLALTP